MNLSRQPSRLLSLALVFPLFSLAVSRTVAETVVAKDSIAAALACAHAGDTVLVGGPALFHERLVIDKSIRLVGADSPVLDGGGIGAPLTIQAEGVQRMVRDTLTGTRDVAAR